MIIFIILFLNFFLKKLFILLLIFFFVFSLEFLFNKINFLFIIF